MQLAATMMSIIATKASIIMKPRCSCEMVFTSTLFEFDPVTKARWSRDMRGLQSRW